MREPDFDTPQFIIDAAKIALDEGYTRYAPLWGDKELRAVIALC
jgi:aspartate/methionine/tyrosine aminotransferase